LGQFEKEGLDEAGFYEKEGLDPVLIQLAGGQDIKGAGGPVPSKNGEKGEFLDHVGYPA
jgi:hypothetical protein